MVEEPSASLYPSDDDVKHILLTLNYLELSAGSVKGR